MITTLRKYLNAGFILLLIIVITILATLFIIGRNDLNSSNAKIEELTSKVNKLESTPAPTCPANDCASVITKFTHPDFKTNIELPGSWEVNVAGGKEGSALYMLTTPGATGNYGVLFQSFNLTFKKGSSELKLSRIFGPTGIIGAEIKNYVKVSNNLSRVLDTETNYWNYNVTEFNIVNCLDNRVSGGNQACLAGLIALGPSNVFTNIQVKAGSEESLKELDTVVVNMLSNSK